MAALVSRGMTKTCGQNPLIVVVAAVLAISLALAAPISSAETSFWVVLGSYAEAERADRAASAGSGSLAESFRVQGADTPVGYRYRVLSGPFLTRALAAQMVEDARATGYPDAWLLATAEPSYEPSVNSSAGSLDLDAVDGRSSDSLGPSGSVTPQADPAGDRASPPRKAAPPEPVTEPPPGYKLHKLHRDAHGPPGPAGQPFVARAGFSSPGSPPGAQTPGNAIQLPFLSSAANDIQVDGHLDEPVWASLTPFTDFRVIEPDTLEPGRYPTSVRVFYGKRGLYFGYELTQPEDTLLERQGSRDDGGLNRDSIAVTLDTSGDGRFGFWFALALGDGQVDGTVLPERRFSRDWDGVWYGRTQRTDTGWTAELMVPWSQLSMPARQGARTIGFYTSRRVGSANERHAYPALPDTQPTFMSVLQPLAVEGVNPRQQWSVFPYVATTRDEVEGEATYRAGADVRWRPTPNLQVSATLNPDFGNVEADDVIVNLTAFEQFFGERRLFFQQEQDVFNTTPRASANEPTTLLNTRRIGSPARSPVLPDDVELSLVEANQPSELLGALKVTGQSGGLRYGVLAAREDETRFRADGLRIDQDGRDFGAVRLLYEDRGESYRGIGLLSTLVAHPEEDALVNGVDLHYLSAGGRWQFDGQLLSSDKDSVGVGYGGFADVVYTQRRGLRYRLSVSHFDDTLDINDFGFLRRNDVTQASVRWEWSTSQLPWARFVDLSAFYNQEVNSDGLRVRDGLFFNNEFLFNNDWTFRSTLGWFPGRFEDRASFGNGTFRIQERPRVNLALVSDPANKLQFRFTADYDGEFVEGGRTNLGVRLIWRPIDRLNVTFRVDRAERDGWALHQEERNFTSFVAEEWRPRLTVDLFASARQQLRMSFQWVGIRAEEDRFYVVPERPGELIETDKPAGPSDDFTVSSLNFQLRYRWEIAPLSDLFVVYTRSGLNSPASASFDELLDESWSEPLGEQLAIKLRYRFGS